MATTIATLTEKNGSFEGVLKTMSVSAPITIMPNTAKTKDEQPDFRIIAKKNGFELGAGWMKVSKSTGEDYMSCAFSSPEFGTIYGNMAPSPSGKADEKVIIWNAPGA